MIFAYYPGCSSQGTSADYEKSTRVVCRDLGVELHDLDDWNCCGSTPAHAVATELSAALCTRNLDLAAKAGAAQLLTPCPSCLSNLRATAKRMEDKAFRTQVDALLDAPSAPVFPPTASVMQGLVEGPGLDVLTARVRRPLHGLRLAPYYGCLMSRPAEIMNFGDPENPTMMEDILRACGAEVLDFPVKTACCGASFGIPVRDMTARLSGHILDMAANMQADAVVVACPLCQMNLDLRQKQAGRALDKTFHMPVLYFTQMMGLAFGHEPADLGFDKLCVSPAGMLRKLSEAPAPTSGQAAGQKAEKKAEKQPQAEGGTA